ncbi:MAG: photosynthetic complex putative assembly protein PuhB [Pseudomonadota bacterium]
MSGDFDFEVAPGLPTSLPEGERILWRGAPDATSFARRVLHVRAVAVYFALLFAWYLLEQNGVALTGGALAPISGALWLVIAAVAAVGILSALAWGYARTTVYILTDKRLIVRTGIALPITFNLPLAHVTGADLKQWSDGTGTIALAIDGTAHLAYPHLWPSVRPWHVLHPQPALRCIGDAQLVATLLTDAYRAVLAEQPVMTAAAQGRPETEAIGAATGDAVTVAEPRKDRMDDIGVVPAH